MKKQVCLWLTVFLLAGSLFACSDEGNTFETKSYTAPDGVEISGIDIQATDRQIQVIPSDDGKIHIDYAESAKEFYDISVSDSGVLTMVLKSDKEWTDYIGVNKSSGADAITVQIPDTALATLSLSTTQEDISLPTLTVTDRLTLSNNGGDISFENISDADSITVQNKMVTLLGRSPVATMIMPLPAPSKKGRVTCRMKKMAGIGRSRPPITTGILTLNGSVHNPSTAVLRSLKMRGCRQAALSACGVPLQVDWEIINSVAFATLFLLWTAFGRNRFIKFGRTQWSCQNFLNGI